MINATTRRPASKTHAMSRRTTGARKTGLSLESLEERTVLSTFAVISSADDGVGSLRQAIDQANQTPVEDTIVFAPWVREITLTSGELEITEDLEIEGSGSHRLRISGNDQSRVFSIGEGVDVEVSDLAIVDGFADGEAPFVPSSGGGILNLGDLSLRDVRMVGNESIGNPEVDISDPSMVLSLGPAFKTAGGAAGGAVANFGTLEVIGSSFRHNQAVAADGIDFVTQPGDPTFPFGAFPGNSFGGAISNFTTDYGEARVTVTYSQFIGNAAVAGGLGTGDFAAIAGGGAIGNDSVLTVEHSDFVGNQAIGGDEASSPFHNGHALGGAISSGSLTPGVVPTVPGASLIVSHSDFSRNEAIGGNENMVTLPLSQIPRADAPNNAYGGAILAFQGTAELSDSSLRHNRAVAGVGGADENGSLAAGGGVFFFNFLGGVSGTVERTTVRHNSAIGGDGPTGGDAVGGGIAAGSLGAPFGAAGNVEIVGSIIALNKTIGGRGSDGVGGNGQGGGIANLEFSNVDVSSSRLIGNQARGGQGTQGGGNGQGGGICNLADSSATLLRSIVFANFANGGVGIANSSNGLGQGGGLFNDVGGDFALDAFAAFFTQLNHASDDGDDTFGEFTLL